MAAVPGIIHLGKFRVVYHELQERGCSESDGYLLQQRAVIRLNEALVKLEEQEDYQVYCNDENFTKEAGKRPSALQYFIASIGFCMFSQLKRFAAKASVRIDDLEMDLRLTYDLGGKLPLEPLQGAAHGLNYAFAIRSEAPLEQILIVSQLAHKGCHTVNSMRKRMPVSEKIVLNDREYKIGE